MSASVRLDICSFALMLALALVPHTGQAYKRPYADRLFMVVEGSETLEGKKGFVAKCGNVTKNFYEIAPEEPIPHGSQLLVFSDELSNVGDNDFKCFTESGDFIGCDQVRTLPTVDDGWTTCEVIKPIEPTPLTPNRVGDLVEAITSHMQLYAVSYVVGSIVATVSVISVATYKVWRANRNLSLGNGKS